MTPEVSVSVLGLALGAANLIVVLRVQLAIEKLRNDTAAKLDEKLKGYYDRETVDAKLEALRVSPRHAR